MGVKESSLRGERTVVRATDYPILQPHMKSGSGPDYPNYYPVHSKGSSSTFHTNVLGFGYYNKPSTAPTQGKSSGVIVFHSSEQWKIHFDAAKDTDKLMVIDFTATWCGPCRAMDAVISDFAAKYTYVEFIKIDVDELHDVAMKYQVLTVPTFLLMKKGQVVGKVVGANKDQLKAKIELFLY